MSRLDDRLDQAIDDVLARRDPDRRGGQVPAELLPLLDVAEELGDDLAGLRLDPALARDHLAAALREPPGRPLAVAGRRPGRLAGWRRRAAVAAAVAVLTIVPAVASASSLPGQPLWPVKQAVDAVKLMAARSPERLASTRVALAAERLDELQRLLAGGPADQVAPAATRLREAIDAAGAALVVARGEGVDSTTLAALESRLRAIAARADDLAAGWPASPGQAGTVTGQPSATALAPLTSLPASRLPAPAGVLPTATTLATGTAPTTTGPPTDPQPPTVPGVLGPGPSTTTTTLPPAEGSQPKKPKKPRRPRPGHGGGGPAAPTTTEDQNQDQG